MRPITVSVGPLTAASAYAIALSQTPAGAGALTLNGALASGGVATLPQTRRVGITSAGNDTGITFTIAGTTFAGAAATEVLTGASGGVAQSVLDYATVTSIVASGAAAGAITVGTTAVASSSWIRMDAWDLSQTALQINVTGTVNYTVQSTLDDPNSPTDAVAASAVTWVNSSDTNVVAATNTQQSNFAYAPSFVRLLLNSGAGSAKMTLIQSGAVTL